MPTVVLASILVSLTSRPIVHFLLMCTYKKPTIMLWVLLKPGTEQNEMERAERTEHPEKIYALSCDCLFNKLTTVYASSRASLTLQLCGAVLSTKLTLNMIRIVLDRSASNYVPSREMSLQERSHKMQLRQKRDTKAQMSYWRGA